MHGTRVKVARKSTLHFKYGRCLEDQAEEKQPTSRRKSRLQDQQPALQMIANRKPTFPDEDCMLHVKFQNHFYFAEWKCSIAATPFVPEEIFSSSLVFWFQACQNSCSFRKQENYNEKKNKSKLSIICWASCKLHVCISSLFQFRLLQVAWCLWLLLSFSELNGTHQEPNVPVHNPALIQSHLPHQVIQVHPTDGKLDHGRECKRKNRARYSAQTISLLEENMAVFLTTTQWSMVCGGGEECMLALPTRSQVSGPLWAVDGQWLVSSTADVPISPSSLRSLPMSSITKNFSEDTAMYAIIVMFIIFIQLSMF